MVGTFEWVRDALKSRGYRAKDLARAWGVSESSTSRWFSGEEQPDLPLSRAATLARMLGITLDDFAKGLGLLGKPVRPMVPESLPQLGANVLNVQMLDNGRVRLTFVRETDPDTAIKVLQLFSE